MKSHEILSRETVLKAHAFDVVRLGCRLPDGRERTYDLVDHANAVTMLPLTAQGEALLVTQYRIGAEGMMLELPAGVMDPGEQPLESARRELREETGMDCGELAPLGSFFMVAGYSNECMHAYLALDLREAPLEQDEDEFLELERLPLAELYRRAFAGQLTDGKTMVTLMLALPKLVGRFPGLLAGLGG
ncbi:MAG: NUDIX hydrolase [Anaerolineaceae bacterium]